LLCSCGTTLQRSVAKKATLCLPLPSSSSSKVALQHNAVKKATAALRPLPFSSSYFAELQGSEEGDDSVAAVTFFFLLFC